MNKITTFSSHFEVPVTALGDWRAFGLPNGGHLVWVEIRDLIVMYDFFLAPRPPNRRHWTLA